MRPDSFDALWMILLSAGATMLVRALPFLVFSRGRKPPRIIQSLADTLPPAIMAVLVVYCLKTVPIQSAGENLRTFLSVAAVAAVHLWKMQAILSLVAGTAFYMLLAHFAI